MDKIIRSLYLTFPEAKSKSEPLSVNTLAVFRRREVHRPSPFYSAPNTAGGLAGLDWGYENAHSTCVGG